MTSSTDAGAGMPGEVGLPSEEAIARAMCGDLDPEEVIFLGSYKKRWQSLLSEARCALSLFRPAFEAKEREIERACADHANATIGWERERGLREAAEAKLAQAVEALEPFAKMAAAYDGLLEKEGVPVLAQNKLRITLNDLRRARSVSRGETE